MTFFDMIIAFTLLSILVYVLVQFIFNEKQIYFIKYFLYAVFIMMMSVIVVPLFIVRPRNLDNIRLAARLLNPVFTLFGIRYRLENETIFQGLGPGIIVANHQSSIDLIGMMKIWPDYVRHCTILAKKELIWAFPFGLTAWLAGVEYVDRQNRQESSKTMQKLTNKVKEKALRVWIFPEGTRNMGETLLPFKFGAFRLAIEAQVPIVPIVFSPYQKIYNVDKRTESFYWRPGSITIRFLEPIQTTGMTVEKDLQRLTDLTRARMIDAYEKLRHDKTQ